MFEFLHIGRNKGREAIEVLASAEAGVPRAESQLERAVDDLTAALPSDSASMRKMEERIQKFKEGA